MYDILEYMGITNEENLFYSLGQRDMLASILAENYKINKMPEEAKLYQENYGEHFTLKWHLE